MLSVQINGEDHALEEAVTLQDFLLKINLTTKAIAVAVNSEIIHRSDFRKVLIRDRDRIEIIRAVGGG